MKKYDPTPLNQFFDGLVRAKGLKNDAALCRMLDVSPSVISKSRRGSTPITPDLMLRMHEKMGVPIADMRAALPADAFYDHDETAGA
ncbi:MAG: helix-turn-helix transcriptional regulator [Pseudomonadota bacterium]